MRVTDDYPSSVVFLCQEEEDIQVPKATAFIVGVAPKSDGTVNLEAREGSIFYLITARHVIEKARSTGKCHSICVAPIVTDHC